MKTILHSITVSDKATSESITYVLPDSGALREGKLKVAQQIHTDAVHALAAALTYRTQLQTRFSAYRVHRARVALAEAEADLEAVEAAW